MRLARSSTIQGDRLIEVTSLLSITVKPMAARRLLACALPYLVARAMLPGPYTGSITADVTPIAFATGDGQAAQSSGVSGTEFTVLNT